MQNITDVLKALNNFKSAEDGTYEFMTHQPVEYFSGYQVSFVRPEAFEQLTHAEWDILTTYFCECLQSKAHIGVYDASTEVSFHSMDFSKAEKVMDKFNQESILNWGEKATFPEDIIRWFIFNPNFDANRVVDYHEILERI